LLSARAQGEQRWTMPPAGLPAVAPLAIALAWATLVAVQATGYASLVQGHAHGQAHGLPLWLLVLLPPFWLTVAGFLAVWLVMVAAMMLPANLIAIRRVSTVVADRPRRQLAAGAFLAGHAFTWGAFGVAAYLADIATHPGPTFALPAVFVAAGLFQFTALKRTCLSHRRHLAAHRPQPAGNQLAAAFRLGRSHGLSCVGCCGPLMLLMLAVRGAPLLWMAGVTALMVCESLPLLARRATPAIGAGLLVAALLMLAPTQLS
jgi:predicted metal-binding membrane protein